MCEGLPAGDYAIKQATGDDVEVRFHASPSVCDPAVDVLLVPACCVRRNRAKVAIMGKDAWLKSVWCALLQRMVQHALALKSGKTYKDISETLAEEVKAEEPKGLLGKITGMFRST